MLFVAMVFTEKQKQMGKKQPATFLMHKIQICSWQKLTFLTTEKYPLIVNGYLSYKTFRLWNLSFSVLRQACIW